MDQVKLTTLEQKMQTTWKNKISTTTEVSAEDEGKTQVQMIESTIVECVTDKNLEICKINSLTSKINAKSSFKHQENLEKTKTKLIKQAFHM